MYKKHGCHPFVERNNISTSGGYNINKIHWIEYEQHLIGYTIIRRISKI
jgi:hypothetical protein